MPVDDFFAFTSDAAMNLHHLLYAEAWSVESRVTGKPSRAQPVPGEPALRAAAAFDDAITYYRQKLIGGQLLFDETLQELSAHLTGRGGAAPVGWSAIFEPLLPAYVAGDWPAHDQHNQQWTTAVTAGLARLLPTAMDRLQELYRRELADPPVLVSTVYVGDRLSAYTSLHPTHITCATSAPDSQGWAAVEIVLHEASHALVRDVAQAIRDRVDVRQDGFDRLWHVSLFFITGEVVARLLAEQGVAYTPYLESTGLFDRAWPQFRQPITEAWTGYLDGRWDRDSACDRLAEAVTR